jgi:SAM-dependent methyltransferase
MKSARRYFQWQYRLAEAQLGRRVLEVGCGLGNFTQLLCTRDLVVAIDVESQCVEALAQRLAGHGNVIARRMDVADPAFVELRRHDPDSIACLNVLEHVADDRQALMHMHSVLPTGGKVVLIVPAFECLYGPVDKNLGHYRRYSRRALAHLAQSAGFQPIIIRYMNFAGFFAWWINAHLLRKTRQSERQIAIFDSLIVPVQSRLERLIGPPCGQSIFAVLARA